MTNAALGDLLRAVPFRPFSIVMGSNRVKVRTPQDVVYEVGEWMITVLGQPADVMIDVASIVWIEFDPVPPAGAAVAEVRRADEA